MNDATPTSVTVIGRAGTPPARSKSRRRRFSVAAGVLAVLLLATAAWWYAGRGSTVRYATAPAARGAVVRAVTATGTVNPILTIIVGSYVSGVIQSLSCDYNSVVKAGQVCAKIDPRPFEATLHQYSAQLSRDQAILAKDQANLARYQKLAQQNSIARQQAEDQAYVVQQDEGTVKLDEALVEGAQFNLGYTDIVSPVDGTVVSRNVTQGQTVAASFQTPTLFLIATDLTQMEVDTNVSESDIGNVKEKNAASFTVEAFPDRTFAGSVAQVRQAPQTLQNVVTYDVVVDVLNADLALKPGMTATVKIVTAERDDVLRVPDQALRYAPAGAAAAPPAQPSVAGAAQGQVWVLTDGKPVRVTVTLGLDDDSYTEITGGELKAGDQVILSEQRGRTDPAVPRP